MNRFFSSFKALLAALLLLSGTALLAQDHSHADEHDAHAEHAEHDAHAHGAEHGDADHNHDGDHGEEIHDHESHAEHAHEEHTHDAHGDHAHDEEFVAGTFIIHHIADAHDIHLFGDVHIPLPVILYIEGEGVQVFMSSVFEGHGHGNKVCEVKGITYTMHAEDGVAADGTPVVSGQITAADAGAPLTVYDFSITKSIFGMLLILAVMVWMFLSIAGYYKKNPGQAPTGMANALEPLIIFVRDEIAKPSIGGQGAPLHAVFADGILLHILLQPSRTGSFPRWFQHYRYYWCNGRVGDVGFLIDQLERKQALLGPHLLASRCSVAGEVYFGADRGVQHHHEAGGIDDSFDSKHQRWTHHHPRILEFDFHFW